MADRHATQGGAGCIADVFFSSSNDSGSTAVIITVVVVFTGTIVNVVVVVVTVIEPYSHTFTFTRIRSHVVASSTQAQWMAHQRRRTRQPNADSTAFPTSSITSTAVTPSSSRRGARARWQARAHPHGGHVIGTVVVIEFDDNVAARRDHDVNGLHPPASPSHNRNHSTASRSSSSSCCYAVTAFRRAATTALHGQ